MSLTLSDEALQSILDAGNWSDTAEDHKDYYGERLPADLVERWVKDYDPADIETTAGLGALTLLTATAAWGVSPSEGLPEDPKERDWAGPATGSKGKHLMSYAVGGVGIDHTDSGTLERLMDYLKEHHPNLAPEAVRFFELRGNDFNTIRGNGGGCGSDPEEIEVDLDGVLFGHASYEKYCDDRDGSTSREDWQIFRHWMRAALRLRDVQRYIIEQWINEEWLTSYHAVMDAGGTVEEAMVNSRIRNSKPYTANCALKKANEGDPDKRIQAQLMAYTSEACKGKEGHERRFGEMLRPVELYRHFR